MKNNKGFTLIELLAVIVVLAIVMVLAITTVLPYMNDAREKAFGVEATSVVDAAINAKDLFTYNQVSITNSVDNTESCYTNTEICFTISELIKLGLYDGDENIYKGKVVITYYNTSNPTYSLSINKNDEFKIINGTGKNYTENLTISNDSWNINYEKCSCNSK